MKKLNKLLLGGALLSVMLAGIPTEAQAYPTMDELKGRTYNFKATKTEAADYSSFTAAYDALPTEFTFDLVDQYGWAMAISGFIIGNDIGTTYDQNAGTIQLNAPASNWKIKDTNYSIYFSDVQYGSGDQSTKPFIWQLSEDGNTITIPNFYVHDYTSDKLIAEYSNIIATTGSVDDVVPDEPDSDSYPTIAELLNTYNFKGTLTQNENGDYQAQFDALSDSFSFTIGGTVTYPTVSNFIGLTDAKTFAYDQNTGVITLTQLISGWLPDYVGRVYVSPVSYGTGDTSEIKPLFEWQANKGGKTITIPDFYVKDFSSDNIIATYSGITVSTEPIGDNPGGGDDGDDDNGEPGPASITGKYSFTADVEIMPDYSNQKGEFLEDFDFTIENTYIDNFVGYDGYLYYSYDQSIGKITITANVLQQTTVWGPNSYMGVQLLLADANGTYQGFFRNNGNIMKWTVSPDGTITIPDFTLIDNNTHAIVAKYSNCQVTVATGGDETYPFPALSDLVKTYNWGGTANIGQESLYSDYIQPKLENASFTLATTVVENQVNIDGLLGTRNGITGTYDRNEGTITFNNQALSYSNEYETWRDQDDIDDDNYPPNVSFGITNGNSDTYPSSTPWVWTVSEEGVITIPDFKVWNSWPYNGLEKAPIVTFTNINLEGGFDEEGNKPEDSWNNPDLSNATLVGTYNWTVLPTSITAETTGTQQTIKVEVLTNGEDTYYIQEVEGTELFNGYIVTATSVAGYLQINQKYAGVQNGKYIYFSGWVNTGITEPNEQIQIQFSEADGFTFDGTMNKGFGWFESTQQNTFEPSGEILSAFYLVNSENEQQPETGGWINPDITGATVVGTYEWAVIPTNLYGDKTSAAETIQVQVLADEDGETYYLQEADGHELFNGYIVKATYMEPNLIFNPIYAGEQGGEYIWFSGWTANSITEPQEQITIEFNETEGFTFTTQPLGFGWFVSDSETSFTPSDLYSGFYLPQLELVLPSFTISDPLVMEDMGSATVSFVAELVAIDVEEIDYIQVEFFNLNNTSAQPISVEGTLDESELTAVLEDLENGKYSFNAIATLYNEEGDIIAASDPVTVEFNITTSGISAIGSENGEVRYFNLNGIEVANPTKGGIYIKVQNGKAVKSVVR